ncbi:MurR/RpiR family transcriptional regulator [Sinorhizobium medicae]|uniref:RpiR family transcriptional regulator n=3 Tax=Sinorhizobium medicae TaxID=110321 RepID=A0ABX4TCR7_9HYPH|nr:putative transcriptional regulator, RpiR family [Sinorhizobium medicae WSM419]MDX0407058.1 MurR/RpiR family transcriptional regulator [Sinorhizobium medicae]MDX0412516.1 MurR/RpiR family transcriptional regulator [Sinorhizobium medicae]MDX0418768.1 MurR/RpiR family transcriptional regulator [Sinorhizobium medicae]MDX0430057.1 MurR/RpiR family transcriptional regulator [Sinorhizobium medicae]
MERTGSSSPWNCRRGPLNSQAGGQLFPGAAANESEEAAMSGIYAPPRSWEELQRCVAARKREFSAQLILLAEFALRHPDAIAFGTCGSIAAHAGVSATTVPRLASFLGYQSFRDLRKMFRDDLLRASSLASAD